MLTSPDFAYRVSGVVVGTGRGCQSASLSRRATIGGSKRPSLLGGERMNDNAKWRAVRLEDLERRGRFIPVREHLGIHSFGINAIKQGEDGTLINEHDEAGSGQEEGYVVLDGTATLEVDGETVEAAAAT